MYLWERWDKASSNSAERLEPVRHRFELLPRQISSERAAPAAVESQAQIPEVESAQILPQLKTNNSSRGIKDRLIRPTVKETAPKLDLSLPDTKGPSTDAGSVERSATVFDPQLTRTIEDVRSRRRSLAIARPEIQGAETFVGGQWRSLIKIGNLCFEVIAADPLDSLSTDQWYRRSCD